MNEAARETEGVIEHIHSHTWYQVIGSRRADEHTLYLLLGGVLLPLYML